MIKPLYSNDDYIVSTYLALSMMVRQAIRKRLKRNYESECVTEFAHTIYIRVKHKRQRRQPVPPLGLVLASIEFLYCERQNRKHGFEIAVFQLYDKDIYPYQVSIPFDIESQESMQNAIRKVCHTLRERGYLKRPKKSKI